MVYSEKTYNLLKMIYKNVAYVANNLYYVSNDREIIDYYEYEEDDKIEWSAYDGYIINVEDNSKLYVQYILLKVIDNYKLILIRTNNKEESCEFNILVEKAYLYCNNTEELILDASDVARKFLWITAVIHLKDNKLLFINDDAVKLDHNVMLVDLNSNKLINTDKIVNVEIFGDKVVISNEKNLDNNNYFEQHEFLIEE